MKVLSYIILLFFVFIVAEKQDHNDENDAAGLKNGMFFFSSNVFKYRTSVMSYEQDPIINHNSNP
jgi:hypothetical protein